MDETSAARVDAALRHWLDVSKLQKERSESGGNAQQGNRAAVTAGAHLDGLNQLVVDEIDRAGVNGLTYATNRDATLAGYYRASKAWDLAVLKNGEPLLVVEYKSMNGSEGKNLNNRSDEVFGVAEDARQAMQHGLLPEGLRRAYIFVMAVTPASVRPVKVGTSLIGKPDSQFDGASYLQRTGIMCRRLRETGLYDMTWAVGVRADPFDWEEPDRLVGWERFAADIRDAFAPDDVR